jgi:hypothetical protein
MSVGSEAIAPFRSAMGHVRYLRMKQVSGLLLTIGSLGLGGCTAADEDVALAPEPTAIANDALYDNLLVTDSACSVTAGGVTSTQGRALHVVLRATTIPGALTATVTSLDDPSLSVTATFDGVWNTFDGSAHTAAGTWLDVRGRMTGNVFTMSYAGRKAPAPDGTVPSVSCLNLTATATFSLPPPLKAPPPTWCDELSSTSVGIHATVRIDTYEGTRPGVEVHEFARATILNLPWIYDARLLDTMHVELAMRVGADSGLPQEIPLSTGQQIEVVGEYIPSWAADAPNPNGHLDAVLHYTHAECGYSIIAGTRYNH